MSFTKAVQPFVEAELAEAQRRLEQGDSALSFEHLENAHVLGQASTKWHSLAHFKMLTWAIHNRDGREIFGQIFRLVGALTKTAFGLIPSGNTGGAKVSPFRSMALKPEHARILEDVRGR